jgi:putative phosphoesterase
VRLGLISDLHGNLPALDAVIGELDESGIDKLICLGDVAPGPQPRETIERLQELDCPVVLGNWDTWLLEGVPPLAGAWGSKLREQGAWQAAQLGESERGFLEALPSSVEVGLAGRTALCVHGSPRSALEDIYATTPDEELSRMLDGSRPAFLAAGHTHVQLARPHESTLFFNPGSVGLPFYRRPPNDEARISPWAEYAILAVDDGRVSTELRRAPYDVAGFLELSLDSGMPHARWWVDCWVGPARA